MQRETRLNQVLSQLAKRYSEGRAKNVYRRFDRLYRIMSKRFEVEEYAEGVVCMSFHEFNRQHLSTHSKFLRYCQLNHAPQICIQPAWEYYKYIVTHYAYYSNCTSSGGITKQAPSSLAIKKAGVEALLAANLQPNNEWRLTLDQIPNPTSPW